MSFANQKSIIIKKEPCDLRNHYAKINIGALQNAMKVLNKTGSMKLWLYLSKNQNGYKFDLSCADCQQWGLKPDSYHTAVKDLIEKGFLVKLSGNQYVFNEMPNIGKIHRGYMENSFNLYGKAIEKYNKYNNI